MFVLLLGWLQKYINSWTDESIYHLFINKATVSTFYELVSHFAAVFETKEEDRLLYNGHALYDAAHRITGKLK